MFFTSIFDLQLARAMQFVQYVSGFSEIPSRYWLESCTDVLMIFPHEFSAYLWRVMNDNCYVIALYFFLHPNEGLIQY